MRNILLILALTFITTSIFAQHHGYSGGSSWGYSGSGSGTITVASVLNLSVSTGGTVSFSNTSDYESGKTMSNYSSIAIKSNESWLLEVAANSAHFTAMGGGATSTMPCSVLGIRVHGSSSFLTISTTSQSLKSGSRGSTSASGHSFDIDLNINPGFDYPGGLYSINLLYTLSKP